VSGFCGLIYESVWSGYLKLFLGHAAYAQTLVLATFMGGMAIGAWITSRYSNRLRGVLLAYAIVEGVIGVMAMTFHEIFIALTDLSFGTIIPSLGSSLAIDLFKWILAAAFILPQAVLLGTTFPLMSSGIIRRFPEESGASLAMLYFTNSFGAGIGVLVAGFALVDLVGLPGTIFTAGLINVLLAVIVWILVRTTGKESVPTESPNGEPTTGIWRLMLLASFVTGTASFIYEIGWIRMLNLVLGTATHAFELMLSAFLFGLAFGGLWIRSRIDRLENPTRFLGAIQIVMGLFALATLVAYNGSFEAMRVVMNSLTRTADGYRIFNVTSHAIALGIMFPATFCAGMTLPLITNVLIRARHGERSIGAIYAANTVGAIAGVFIAVHILLPAMGLKGLITIGAALDMMLGVGLLYITFRRQHSWVSLGATALAGVAVIVVVFGVDLDRYKMASGVYRSAKLYRPGTVEVLFHRDGKTASVDLLKHRDGSIGIVTNGKSDALISGLGSKNPSVDESTMTMLAAIPIAIHPSARMVANIGLGSGLTAHVFLGATNIKSVDTIEIEPAMVEAARGFGARVERVFKDPRSHIYIEDAKTFFASHGARYDVIVSEPSNPWVSGVAGLFSEEFYRLVRTHLHSDGLFVQWIQLYEIDTSLVASVMKAIDKNFPDYGVYASNDGDLIIAAKNTGKIQLPDYEVLASQPGVAAELRRINITTTRDFQLHYLGNKSLFAPLFAAVPVPTNSDFYPIVDLNAARTRFMLSSAEELLALSFSPLPALEMLGRSTAATTAVTPNPRFTRSRRARTAIEVRDYYRNGSLSAVGPDGVEAELARRLLITGQSMHTCGDAHATELWLDSVYEVVGATFPHLQPQETEEIWQRWKSSDCYTRLTRAQKESMALFRAVGRRDSAVMATNAERLLQANSAGGSEQVRYLLSVGMLGYLADGRPKEAQRLWAKYAPRNALGTRTGLLLQLLWAHAFAGELQELPMTARTQER